MCKGVAANHQFPLFGALLCVGHLLGGGCEEQRTSIAANAKTTTPAPARTASPKQAQVDELRTPGQRLAEDHQAESPQSNSKAAVQVLSAAADKNHALVVIGRAHLLYNGKVVARTRCQYKSRACTPTQRRGSVSLTSIDMDPKELEAFGGDVVVRGLRKAAVGAAGVPVAIVGDRRVRAAALRRVIDTLRHVGARPIVAALDGEGRVVLVGRQEGLSSAKVARAAGAKGLPQRIARATLQIAGDRAVASLQPAIQGAEPLRNQLHGDRRVAVTKWADRIAEAYPDLAGVYLAMPDDAPMADIVPTLDALRDRCGEASVAGTCRQRVARFAVVKLEQASERAGKKPPVAVPMAPPGALSAELLGGLGGHKAMLAPPVPVPHELLQPAAIAPNVLHSLPGRAPHLEPNLGGPPQAP